MESPTKSAKPFPDEVALSLENESDAMQELEIDKGKTVSVNGPSFVLGNSGKEVHGLISEPYDVCWQNISYAVRKKEKKVLTEKTILHPVSGVVQRGRVCAIMGPSGSGKTSFLDAVAGRLKRTGGKVLFNGQQMSSKQRRKIMSYVHQNDALMGVFTVKETLDFAAQFHFGWSISKEQRNQFVDQIINDMGLTSAAHTVVGDIFRKGISGGQKRRLSIAVELISSPSVILLDEPTSGLDSASAWGVVSHLRHLASNGHTILTVIHQPSSEIWGLFDDFFLLSNGRPLYFGPANAAVEYFAAIKYVCPAYTNPADFLVSIVNTDFEGRVNAADPIDLEIKYRRSETYKSVQALVDATKESKGATKDTEPNTTIRYKILTDFIVLSKRNILNNVYNPGIYWVRFVMYVMLSLMIGFMYWDLGNDLSYSSINSRVSSIFYVAAFLVFMSVAVLPFFIQERAVFLREKENGAYGVATYVISNYFCSIPGIFTIALFSSICVIFPSGMNGFGVYLACLFFSLLAAESFMALMASLVPHYIIGIALGAGAFGFFMLCEGFFIVRSDIPPWFIWGYYIGFHSYTFRVFMYNEFSQIEEFEPETQSFGFVTGQDVLRFYDFEDVNVPLDLLTICIFGIVFQLCFYLVLLTFYKGQR